MSYKSAGDSLCAQLFHDEGKYVSSARATDMGLDQLYGRYLDRAHTLPLPPTSVPIALRELDTAMRSAHNGPGEPAPPLWNLIGAARANGIWRCGSQQEQTLRRETNTVQLAMSRPDQATYANELKNLEDDFGRRHLEYHAHPDPIEQGLRLPNDHGPGFLALERDYATKVAALGAPPGLEPGVRVSVAFLRETVDRTAEAVTVGGQRGATLFESGFGAGGEFIGAICLAVHQCS